MGLCQYVELVCILFGMPSLHLFTFSMFFSFLFLCIIIIIFIKIIKNHTGVGLAHAQPNNIQHSVCYKIDIHTTYNFVYLFSPILQMSTTQCNMIVLASCEICCHVGISYWSSHLNYTVCGRSIPIHWLAIQNNELTTE